MLRLACASVTSFIPLKRLCKNYWNAEPQVGNEESAHVTLKLTWNAPKPCAHKAHHPNYDRDWPNPLPAPFEDDLYLTCTIFVCNPFVLEVAYGVFPSPRWAVLFRTCSLNQNKNIPMPAANISNAVARTQNSASLELGCLFISLLSEATNKIPTNRKGARMPLMIADQ